MRTVAMYGTSLLVISALFLSGCAAVITAGQVQSGRQALLTRNPELALGYLEEAVRRDPEYRFVSHTFQQTVWTYLGRARYETGRFPEARQSFEKALSHYQHDSLARMYLGLTMARTQKEPDGLKQVESGMRELHEWLEYEQRARPFTAFWDPLRHIRREIESSLHMIEGKDVDWPALIASGEWVGYQVESEIERVRRDERRRFERGDGRRTMFGRMLRSG
jgi:tetratricopeptide (TPR) repeat protein